MAIERRGGVGAVLVMILGGVLALIGAVLVVGGVQLIALGGSWYYALAGLGLVAAGVLLILRKTLGVWVYLGVFAITLLWALWEVGLNGWALVPRVVAPLVLLVPVVAALAVTKGRGGGRMALMGLGGVALATVIGGVVVAQANRPVTPEALPAIAGDMAEPNAAAGEDWPAYGGSYSARRYSSLTQINRDNVGRLERVWTFRTGDLPDEKWGTENTPLKVGDTLYLCSARNIIIALDARTGRQKWRYDPQVSDDAIPYTAACRGVAYYDTRGAAAATPQPTNDPMPVSPGAKAPPLPPCTTRIIEGTLDGRLIAVDAQSGRLCPGFGTSGQVDIKIGMGQIIDGMVSITSAPTIVQGVVVTGHQVLDGQYDQAPSGVIQGFDAMTGELRWAWDLGRPETTGLPPEGQEYTRGTPNMWTTATGDEQLGLVYLPMGNSAADYWSTNRSAAENEYSTSLVALDVRTGRPAWRFQTVHVDVWDYDLGSQATLIDYPTTGGVIPALVLPSKQGDLYILDRRTGRALTPVQNRPVPQGGVEANMRTPTQPFSRFHTLARPNLTERDMWGMSPIDQMVCRIGFRQASYEGMYTPPTADRRWIQYPGYNGGSDWGGVAVDPRRGVIIANYNDMPNYNRLVPREVANAEGWYPRGHPQYQAKAGAEGAGDPQWGVPYAIDVNAGWRMGFTGMLCKQPPYGGIRAIDIRTGRTLWDRPFGTARNNGPFGIPSRLPLDIGTPNNGGAVVTAGGLIFIAAATDDLIRAIDIETGETVWSDVLPAGGQSNPMVYAAGGRQYLVIAPGGHHFMETPAGDQVIAYALPEGA